MLIYVLTRCSDNKNYQPEVFGDLEDAKKAMTRYWADCRAADGDLVAEANLYDEAAEIIWADGTQDFFQVFESKIKC